MRTFRIFLHQRDAPPALHLVTARDEAMAKAIAVDLLEGSAASVRVEVWFGERRLFVRGATAPRRFDGKPRRCGARHGAPKLLD